ncbi:hypothetical protein M405DRAFT_535389 [Rhizopogon salebrosus TDB-379]|nr:hypothetical protein M405DRAFT_535389 [Rhizopogon salebrosus TDB-379]
MNYPLTRPPTIQLAHSHVDTQFHHRMHAKDRSSKNTPTDFPEFRTWHRNGSEFWEGGGGRYYRLILSINAPTTMHLRHSSLQEPTSTSNIPGTPSEPPSQALCTRPFFQVASYHETVSPYYTHPLCQ